ncbi:hypothetical protein VNO77_26743 [Canavalia gladiata]|uniref:Uncharacterized protein n=1 Tax=Canavalia gladiata TaxID=3824 RepID=A0AAN9KVX4_CANGL
MKPTKTSTGPSIKGGGGGSVVALLLAIFMCLLKALLVMHSHYTQSYDFLWLAIVVNNHNRPRQRKQRWRVLLGHSILKAPTS